MYFDNLVLMAVSAPIEMKGRKGPTIVDTDEHPRPQTQIADLTKLKPVFNPEDVFNCEDVACSRCGDKECVEDNDILMCDLEGCARAYHQKCLVPILKTADIPPGDDEWFCDQCRCRLDVLAELNDQFGTDWGRTTAPPAPLPPLLDVTDTNPSWAAGAGAAGVGVAAPPAKARETAPPPAMASPGRGAADSAARPRRRGG